VRIAIADRFGGCLSWAKRLHDEGHTVLWWIGSEKGGPCEHNKKVGTGIVPRTNGWINLLRWCKEGIHAGEPTMMLFASSWMGKYADEARQAGIYVVGGGAVCDRMERERDYGKKIAEEAGMILPPYESFPNLNATLAYAKGGNVVKPVYFKSDSYITDDVTQKCEDAEQLVEYLESFKDQDLGSHYKNTLEECVDGVAVSTERWWNGRAFVGPYFGTIEHKKLMNDEIGPSTGCAFNAVWAYQDDPQIAEALNWDAIATVFSKHEVPAGLFDANAILCDGEAYFLEWCARLGYDSEPTGQLLYKDLGAWLWYVATGQGDGGGFREGLAVSVHLSVPPYPCDALDREQKESPVGVHVSGNLGNLWSGPFIGYCVLAEDDQLMVGGPDGSLGLSAAVGDSLEDLAEEILDFAKNEIRVPGLQYRTDVAKCISEDAEDAREQGFEDLPKELYS
jgi:phosphoribosylamine-glycine ligase